MRLDRFLGRLRPDVPDEETREAMKRTEEIHERIRRQEPEVRRQGLTIDRIIRENDLSPRIRRAVGSA